MNSLHRYALALALLCCSLPAVAAELVWGTGVWGDTWAAPSSTPTTLTGTAFKGQADPVASSAASFAIGLTLNHGGAYTTTASVSQDVRIIGFITPEPQHVGQLVDIFVVDRVNLGSFLNKNQDGVWLLWNGRVADLVPWREDVLLTNNLQVDIFTGRIGTPGDHRIFLGYMPADGTLRYTPIALRLNFNP